MRILKRVSLFATLMLAGAMLSAQTADNVISKYLDAIGGKKNIAKIKSLYVEGTMELQGMVGNTKTTTLNGKGVKTEVDMMGSMIVSCITDQGGWIINPFMGSGAPEDMPATQYNSAKYQIDIGGPFIKYAENGFKAELAGEANVGDAKALKVIMTSPENVVSEYFFDAGTGYLLRSVEAGDMGKNISTFSDYREESGFKLPFSIEIDAAGGQVFIYSTVVKVEVNKAVDESILNRPQ